jgi:hypothetical protein
MPSNQTLHSFAFIAVLAFVACAEPNAQAAEGKGSRGEAVTRPDDPGATPQQRSTDRVQVTIAGTRLAGSHEASADMHCHMYAGTWQANFEQEREVGLSAMLVQLKEVPAAGGSTDKVSFTVTFGQMDDMSGNAGMFLLHGAESGGDARATVTRDGRGAVLSLEGTHEGARVSAVVRCGTVEFLQ